MVGDSMSSFAAAGILYQEVTIKRSWKIYILCVISTSVFRFFEYFFVLGS